MSNRLRLFMQHLASASCLFAVLCCVTLSASANPTPSADASVLENKKFLALRDMLPIYQAAVQNPWPSLPDSTKLLTVGRQSHSVLILRERLRRTEDLTATNDRGGDYFDESLAEAVKVFQWRHGLEPDGVVGHDTIAALNVPPEVRVKQILINMERWANLSSKLGDRYILVNIPDFRLHVIDHDKPVLGMKVIVGRPERQTPEVTSRITRLVLDPYWNVPEMIANKDIVPKVLDNPSYLEESDIRIYSNDSEDSAEISPDNIDWQSAADNGFNYHFRQEPGEKNSLGLVKFEFPNSFDVYLHDTPAKSLFAKDVRDFSSGCVRLERPFDLVTYLTQDDPAISQDRITEILDRGKTTYVKVPRPIPIIIAYLTAWVDENGIMQFRDDIYQKDFPAATASESAPEHG